MSRILGILLALLLAGRRELVWNGRDRSGSRVRPGVYFFTLEVEGNLLSRRLVLLRD